MKIKYYFIFFAIFALIAGGGFYAFNPSESAFSFGDTPLILPNAIWMVGGVSLFFFLSLLFFTSDWLAKTFSQRKLDKDYQKLISQIYAQILQDSSFKPQAFKTKDYKILSKVLEQLNLSPKAQTQICENEKIDSLLEQIQEIYHGNISKLPLTQNTELWKANTQNKLRSDYKFAQKIIEEDYDENLKNEAIKVLAQNNLLTPKLLQKLIDASLSPSLANALLQELLKHGYKLSEEDFSKLILSSNPHSLDYLELAKTFKSHFDPEYTLALFANLAQQSDSAKESYVFLLLDYGMSDKADEFIRENEELVLAKAYLELKQSGKTYPLEAFFKSSTCKI